MKKKHSITMTEYSDQLNRKMLKVTRHARGKKAWRWIAFLLTIGVCVFAVLLGIRTKTEHLETQYQKYCIEQDRTLIDSKLLDYKDTLQIFEKASLGNSISQMQMGGFFYSNECLAIFPDPETGCTNIKINDVVNALSEGFASNINVYENCVYFRDAASMKLTKHDLNTHKSYQFDLGGVDHFAICDGIILFVDSNSKELKLTKEDCDPEVLSGGAVVSFAIAGNQVLYLQEDHTLHSINISTRLDEIVAHNVNSFFYNGKLWIQNNTDIYVKALDGNTLEPLVCAEECYRILGVTSDYLIFDGPRSICVYNLDEQVFISLDENCVFVGATDDGTILVYDMGTGTYQMIQL